MSKTCRLYTALASLLFLWGCASQAAQPAGKPQSPVVVKISPVQTPQPGTDVEFLVTATVKISAAELLITVQPPQDMELKSGALSWHGALDRGETKTLRFTGRFSDQSNQRITATAVIKSAIGVRLASRADYVVNQASYKAQSEKSSMNNTTRDGRQVIEYPLP
jgi:hypothetical protein